MKKHLIKEVKENSIAKEMEIISGDSLCTINHQEIHDIFDYQMLCEDEYVVLEIEKQDGEIWELEIDKYEDEDLGLVFENGLMDDYHSCCNKCIFCFIDQMPQGMRETLYFKDDDSRLSFLQGNYVTLTNMTEEDVSRIIRYHLAPINISIHTMNPRLRCKMLNNRFAGEKLAYLDRFSEAGLEMNGQIVLCKGVNDGAELEDTLTCLEQYIPHMQSVSVVPAGLTKFRQGLYPLELFQKNDARKVIETIENRQKIFYEKYGTHFVHASDEWYIMAGMEMPEHERYDGYPQLENGVGMIRLFVDEAMEALAGYSGDDRDICLSTFTGELAYPTIQKICSAVTEKFPKVQIHVHKIINDFFGHSITVTGLLTGQDIIRQLKGKTLGEQLLIPTNTLKSGETVFLDDITVKELENNLQIKSVIVKSSGGDFIKSILDDQRALEQTSTASRYEP